MDCMRTKSSGIENLPDARLEQQRNSSTNSPGIENLPEVGKPRSSIRKPIIGNIAAYGDDGDMTSMLGKQVASTQSTDMVIIILADENPSTAKAGNGSHCYKGNFGKIFLILLSMLTILTLLGIVSDFNLGSIDPTCRRRLCPGLLSSASCLPSCLQWCLCGCFGLSSCCICLCKNAREGTGGDGLTGTIGSTKDMKKPCCGNCPNYRCTLCTTIKSCCAKTPEPTPNPNAHIIELEDNERIVESLNQKVSDITRRQQHVEQVTFQLPKSADMSTDDEEEYRRLFREEKEKLLKKLEKEKNKAMALHSLMGKIDDDDKLQNKEAAKALQKRKDEARKEKVDPESTTPTLDRSASYQESTVLVPPTMMIPVID